MVFRVNIIKNNANIILTSFKNNQVLPGSCKNLVRLKTGEEFGRFELIFKTVKFVLRPDL